MLHNITVMRRKIIARLIESTIDVHGDKIDVGMKEILSPFWGDGEVPDFVRILRGLGGLLAAERVALEKADDAFLIEEARDIELRLVRDEATELVYRQLLAITNTVDHNHGPRAAEAALGLGPGLRPLPEQMFDIGRRTIGYLSDPDFRFERPGRLGKVLDPIELKAELVGPYEQLKSAMHALDQERDKYNDAASHKEKRSASFNLVLRQVAGTVRSWLLLIGETKLAERIPAALPRPPGRKPATGDADGPGDGDGEAADKAGDDAGAEAGETADPDSEAGETAADPAAGDETPPPTAQGQDATPDGGESE